MTKLNAKVGGIKITFHIFYEHCVKIFRDIWNMNSLKRYSDLLLSTEDIILFLYSGSLWSSLYCGVSSLWVGLYRWLVKVSWLGKLVSVFWWVELDFFTLECNEVSNKEL